MTIHWTRSRGSKRTGPQENAHSLADVFVCNGVQKFRSKQVNTIISSGATGENGGASPPTFLRHLPSNSSNSVEERGRKGCAVTSSPPASLMPVWSRKLRCF